ncbi:MAG: PAS domain-containing sensor histidine kinase [Verrucomicrobia bacterium RIFCSPHIGHO2_12_FULL_41_10]|nr:MAG: PAS domain-containing sensor histidine kinase [Verrucomicrobia bacterium RIFCSPHIGHO2_12_FULL_41_10]HLB33863.1 ATP-binding protein [Chthoniobacterales bacterium]
MKRGFLDKLIERIRLVQPHEVGQYLQDLAREKGFLETIFNSLREGVIVTDPQERIIYLNRVACDFFGLQGLENIGRPLPLVVPGLHCDFVSHATDIFSRDLEVFYPEHRFLNFYVAPLMSDEPESNTQSLVGRAIILRDITSNRRQTAETIESERFSVATLLAAGVAHEIGNPLNSLTIHLQLLQRRIEKLPPEQSKELEKSLSIATNEVTRLDQIISQFLQAIRPAPLDLKLDNLNTIILESLSFLGQEIHNRKVKLDLALNKHIPSLSLDRNQFKQALYNIIRNSFQAMKGGGILRLLTGCDETHVWMSIGDTGGGIPTEQFDKIFQPYFTTKSDGNGLGLLIVQRIVRAHGGEIMLENAEGKGLIFTIRLPRSDRRVRFLPPIGEGN